MNWKNAKWLVLDTETTGLKPKEGARVWEIGWAEVSDGKLKSKGVYVLNPGVEVPPEVVKLTKMDPKELEGKSSFAEIADELSSKISAADLVIAYNAPFDKAFFENEYKVAKKSMPSKPWLDPLIWARRIMKSENHKLATVAQNLKVKLDQVHPEVKGQETVQSTERYHRADYDAAITAKVALEFISKDEIDRVLPDELDEMLSTQSSWDNEQAAARRANWLAKKKEQNPKPQGESKYNMKNSMKNVFIIKEAPGDKTFHGVQSAPTDFVEDPTKVDSGEGMPSTKDVLKTSFNKAQNAAGQAIFKFISANPKNKMERSTALQEFERNQKTYIEELGRIKLTAKDDVTKNLIEFILKNERSLLSEIEPIARSIGIPPIKIH
jgi:DNA polymerase III epsilon subunit-like protein